MADKLSSGADRGGHLLDAAGDHLADAARVRLLKEITNGSVDPGVYARYLLIEEEFVHTAARVLGAAVWHSPGWEATVGHARALFGLVTEQREYFARARADWPARAELSPAARRAASGLSVHVVRAASEYGYPAIVTSMFAAEQLYLTWCTAAAALDVPRDPAIQDWVELHTRPPFTDQVTFLRSEVDAVRKDVSDTQLLDWFTAMLTEECRFHDSVYL